MASPRGAGCQVLSQQKGRFAGKRKNDCKYELTSALSLETESWWQDEVIGTGSLLLLKSSHSLDRSPRPRPPVSQRTQGRKRQPAQKAGLLMPLPKRPTPAPQPVPPSKRRCFLSLLGDAEPGHSLQRSRDPASCPLAGDIPQPAWPGSSLPTSDHRWVIPVERGRRAPVREKGAGASGLPHVPGAASMELGQWPPSRVERTQRSSVPQSRPHSWVRRSGT